MYLIFYSVLKRNEIEKGVSMGKKNGLCTISVSWMKKLEASQMIVNAESCLKKSLFSIYKTHISTLNKVPHCIVSLVLSCDTINGYS